MARVAAARAIGRYALRGAKKLVGKKKASSAKKSKRSVEEQFVGYVKKSSGLKKGMKAADSQARTVRKVGPDPMSLEKRVAARKKREMAIKEAEGRRSATRSTATAKSSSPGTRTRTDMLSQSKRRREVLDRPLNEKRSTPGPRRNVGMKLADDTRAAKNRRLAAKKKTATRRRRAAGAGAVGVAGAAAARRRNAGKKFSDPRGKK